MMMPFISDKPIVAVFDLDDTLYKEIDFLKSGYQAISSWLQQQFYTTEDTFEVLFGAYQRGDNAFKILNQKYGLDVSNEQYLKIYREHLPKISLDKSVYELLCQLKSQGVKIGLLTDGRSVTQRNKISALGLNEFVEQGDIVISEEFGTQKPDVRNYRYFADRYPNSRIIYVGDNPIKDFVAANILGWQTIELMDDGRNIHKQRINQLEHLYYAKQTVVNITQILDYLR